MLWCLAPALAAGPAVAVATEPAIIGPVPLAILANGTVVSENVVTVRARVDGQIEQVHVTEGQYVRRGQKLFTLDSRLNQALLAQQEANLLRDRALAVRAQADAVRYSSLRGEGYAAQQRVEQASADAAAAAANVKADEALIAQTKLNIDYATILAEMDGQLGALPLKAGNFMRQAENTPIATITQIDPIKVQFSVPERWLPEIRRALREGSAEVAVRGEQEGAPPPGGKLVFVDSQVDTTTGTIGLKAQFPNADRRLWPGQYVQVTLTPRVEPDGLTVPGAALQVGQNGRFVFVLRDGVAHRRDVTLLRMVGERAVVRGPLQDGDRVVVEGAQRLADGFAAVDRKAASAANNPNPSPLPR